MLRFAPSPTGDMHIGNLRVAIFNYLLAKKENIDLVIRIEDTDKKRNVKDKDKEILEILSLFSIEYKSVSYQSQNLKYHQKMAMKLITEKKAFSCFCSDETLLIAKQKAKSENKAYRYDGACENLTGREVLDNEKDFSVRIKKPETKIDFHDDLRGDFSFSPFEIDDFVILRKDKSSTYNFACGVDDMLMDISIVLRGEDHISNTPKQIFIRQALGYDKKIRYIHLPIILSKISGKKMSKRDDSSSVKGLLKEGFLPIAIANYLVLLGNKTPKEIFDLDEAVSWFEIKNLSKSPAKFDIDKLRFINKEHLKKINEQRLIKLLGFEDKDFGFLAKIYLEECSTLEELKERIKPYFEEKNDIEEFKDDFLLLQKTIQEAEFFEDFEEFKANLSKITKLKGKSLFKPLRYILTGSHKGPNLSVIYPHIKNYLGEITK